MYRLFVGAMTALLLAPSARAQEIDLSAPIPIDPQVRIGTLDNGLRYYVRANGAPEGQVSFRLIVKVGALAEEDGELGAAHFVEHTALSNSDHFPDRSLFSYIESLGLVLALHGNAFTSADQTRYLLDMPADNPVAIDTALVIIKDYMAGVRFDPVEVDKERVIVLEEERLRREVADRFFLARLSPLYRNSRYEERLDIIGTPAVLDTIGAETLRNFWRRWYRPDLAAVIAVGNLDPEVMEDKIRRRFSDLPRVDGPPVPVGPIPDHDEPLITIFTDPEFPDQIVDLNFKHDRLPNATLADFRRLLVRAMAIGIINERLDGIAAGADPPFIGTVSGDFNQITKHFYIFRVEPGARGFAVATEALLTEIERIRRFGFVDSELEREQRRRLSLSETRFNERDRFPSGGLADSYGIHFLYGTDIPSVEFERDIVQRLVPTITLAELAEEASVLLRQESRALTLGAPERADLAVPDEADLRAMLQRVLAADLTPFVDSVVDLPLMPNIPEPAALVEERQIPELGASEWILENGARVVLMPTELRNDQILFTAVSPGGHSLVPDADFANGVLADEIVGRAGVGAFSDADLDKKLAGQVAFVRPIITVHDEGLIGQAAPRDIETLFQLIHLSFTEPRRDELTFAKVLQEQRNLLENRDPAQIARDTLNATLFNNHPRAQVVYWTDANPNAIPAFAPGALERLDLDRALEIYRDRFADPGNFTFFFVGSIDLEEMRSLAQTYLATLPSAERQESFRDLGFRPPPGPVEKVVRAGREAVSSTELVFTNTFEWSQRRRIELVALGQMLNVRVFEALRSELGEVYSAGAGTRIEDQPVPVFFFRISFDSDPEDAETLAAVALAQAEFLRVNGPFPEEVAVLKQQARFFLQAQMQSNEFWLNELITADRHGLDLRSVLELDRITEEMTAESLHEAAQLFLKPEDLVKVVLVPEGFESTAVLEAHQATTPDDFALEPNFPNPFNSQTVIRFALPTDADVELAVYNMAGQQVAVLVSGERRAGHYNVYWDGRDQSERPLASGVYLYKLRAGDQVQQRKLLLLR